MPHSSLNLHLIGLKIGASEAHLNFEWNTSLVEQNPPGFDLGRTAACCVARIVDVYCVPKPTKCCMDVLYCMRANDIINQCIQPEVSTF